MLCKILGKCFSIKGANNRQRALHDRANLESPLPVVILSYKRSGKHIEHLSTPEHKLNKDESPLKFSCEIVHIKSVDPTCKTRNR